MLNPIYLLKLQKILIKMKNINKKTKAANENTTNLMIAEFNFDPKEMLNKILILIHTNGRWGGDNRYDNWYH